MSVESQVAILTPGRRFWERPPRPWVADAQRPRITMVAFCALGLYGVLRWATLLSPVPFGRLFGLLGLSVGIAVLGPRLAARSRIAALVLVVVALLAVFALSGVPLAWTLRFRVAVTASGIGQGLAALPQVLVPYLGINDWVRVVILLGAGVLLLDAGIMFAFAPRGLGDLRRAGIALPLVALAIVPATLVHPRLPYLQGLVLFALLVAFLWGERLGTPELPTVIAAVGLAAVAGGVAAPALDQHHPWFNYQGLAGSFSATHVERFEWSQHYGPLNWPRTGHEVLDVQAQQPDYWKAENLDLFNGTGWTEGGASAGAEPLPSPTPASLARWTQTLKVTIRGMSTADVIAAGDAGEPAHVAEGALPGVSPGTWTAAAPLGPGDTYTVQVYSPHPSAPALQSAGTTPPLASLQIDRAIVLPPTINSRTPPEVLFPPFHSGEPVQAAIGAYGADGTSIVESSPYAQAFALARRLSSQASTPYAFVASVERFLSHGYVYDENPPARAFPLESFLFTDKRGYCQQFSGAMALLLRMGGLPARVAAGFTTGTYDSGARHYVVSDLDAHSWVEVWFPQYGWVRFDPTPAAAPARGGGGLLPALSATSGGSSKPTAQSHQKNLNTPAGGHSAAASHHAGSSPAVVLVAGALVLGALALMMRAAVRRPAPTDEQLLSELERAMARCGRPLAGGATLASLEHRFRGSPDAVSYLQAIRMSRFAGTSVRPTAQQRRAVRVQLRYGLGIGGRMRAMWALPPRIRV